MTSANPMNMNDDVMTSVDVAKFLHVHLGSIRRWSRSGALKGYRLGGRGDWRFMKSDVLDFLFGSGELVGSEGSKTEKGI